MEDLCENVRKHKKACWMIAAAYLVFSGCFNFPIRMESRITLSSPNFVILMSIVMIGMLFGLLVEKGLLKVFLTSLGCSAAGLVCRYLLEWGEVSNSVNFTPINIGMYLAIVSVGIALVYFFISALCANVS